MGKKEKKEKKEKPLDRMTAKELRETALKIPEITGVHGLNKAELLAAIKKARGIADDVETEKSSVSIRETKAKIQALKAQRAGAYESEDKAKAKILRRRISRLKKKTRRAA
ncbi:MAG: transcription termination factor Rho [Desulfobacterales bacterium]|nr:transcription termination factor Rho [Desulfobacterales bacterium]